MFDCLSDRLNSTLTDLRSRGRLSEEDVAAAMREIRLALLEADVNFKVVSEFVAKVRERAVGEGVLTSLNPGQQVIKIVDEELAALMGTGNAKLAFRSSPSVILMAGLQGSGKTTTSGKLAKLLEKQGRKPALVACDVYRPAAIEQLKTVGAQVGVPVFDRGTDVDPVEIATWGVQQARQQGRDTVIVDTAGRLHVDDDLMAELVRIRDAVKPDTTLLVLDAMTGQDAVNVAETFRDAGRVRRHHHDEARRRRARRRGAVRAGRHRHADPVRVGRREARPARGVPPRPHGVAHPRHGRRAEPDRAHRGDRRPRSGRRDGGEAPQVGVHAGRPARAAADDPEDGIAGRSDEDDPRSRQAIAGRCRSTTGSSIGSRRLSCP